MVDMSVILLSYNCDEEPLKKTISSILAQTDISYEIIIADDCSKNDCVEIAVSFLEQNNFKAYRVSSHPENVGTVQNIMDAVKKSSGRYIKCIGAGDLLFDTDTLKKVKAFMDDEGCTLCYGLMRAYNYTDGKLNEFGYHAPLDIKTHIKNNRKKISKNIIQNHGWIPGACMFYEKASFETLLGKLTKTVRYCEDLVQVMYLLNNEKTALYEYPVVYYEHGSGISTNSSGSVRIQNDHNNFWDMLISRYPDNHIRTSCKAAFVQSFSGTDSHVPIEKSGEFSYVKKGYHMNKLIYIPNRILRLIKILFYSPSYIFMNLSTASQDELYKADAEGSCHYLL